MTSYGSEPRKGQKDHECRANPRANLLILPNWAQSLPGWQADHPQQQLMLVRPEWQAEHHRWSAIPTRPVSILPKMGPQEAVDSDIIVSPPSTSGLWAL